MLKNSQ